MVGLEIAEEIARRLRPAEPRALRQNRIDPRGIVFGCGHVPSLAIGRSIGSKSSRPDPSNAAATTRMGKETELHALCATLSDMRAAASGGGFWI